VISALPIRRRPTTLLGLCALATTLLFTAAARAQVDEPAESARCRRIRATAESQAFLLASPVLWVEGVHVPGTGDESGAGVVRTSDPYQLRAALSWSPIDLARGVLLLEQASAECRQVEAERRLRRVLSLGDGVGELAARRAEREVLVGSRGEVASIVARATAQLASGVGTRRELAGIEAEAIRLDRRIAQLDGEIARLVEAGHEELDVGHLAADLADYEESAVALEDRRSSMRRLSPWTVSLRGGVIPGGMTANTATDWFGQVQVGVSLGIFAHHVAEDEIVTARRAELDGEEGELRDLVDRLRGRLRAGLPALREELGHLDAMIALQERQRELLAALETSDVETARTMIELVLVGLRGERARIATSIEERERVLHTESHADE
jgi:hypothetical protein